MERVANVIVDVPAMQTNQPYSYLIPAPLTQTVALGMRVAVPFGRGNRLIQGFVVGFSELDPQDEAVTKLKMINAVLDLKPVLNQELISLSGWLAHQAYAFQITVLQAMLPSMFRAKYKKYLRPIDEINDPVVQQLFGGRDLIEYDETQFTPEQVSKLTKLQREGSLEFYYEVNNQAKAKTKLGIKTLLDFEQLEEARSGLTKAAHKQSVLLSLLQTLAPEQVVAKDQVVAEYELSDAVITTGAKKGWLAKVPMEVYRDPMAHHTIKPSQALTLQPHQQAALTAINDAAGQAQTFLLEGVTGSGKTEVYLQAMQHTLAQGRTALMLVPEIALTPQMMVRVRSRFGSQVAVLHSGLSVGERYDEWRRIENGEARVVVGARSAVFAPLDNIGLIIMDEEHETTYKQEENPRYHARDVAMWRSQYYQAPLVLGSATPSLESRARAQKGVYQLLMMPERINQQIMPTVQIVDMREEIKKGPESTFSEELLVALKERLARGEQSVLMLNRRGFSSFMMCRDCGYVLQCPNCDIGLTLHMDTHSMKCHYCGHEEGIPKMCPNCQSTAIRYYGTGTQKVEQELHELLPEARILRMDLDTTRKKGAHENMLTAFGAHQADILLGTQMIAKGLDFPLVTLVGVLNADTALGLPDFHAAERTFQLLTQVAGRAGRADLPGEVYVQTYNPDHYAIQLAKAHDYEHFYQQEMQLRHLAKYPPYFFTIKLQGSDLDERTAAQNMSQIGRWLKKRLPADTIFLGPTPRSIARINQRYYYQIVIKYRHQNALDQVLNELLERAQTAGRNAFQLSIDREPVSFM
ncbi:primosomal protein N' [Periweissella ghanensis]|uniref:Replication restart protein PriA n=1 Tax=Periweissella ghanensis TaxID=467997 RepID=A0ABM8Z8C2_9LACO|nr:primosomal protein N' [Periweissella ghanensis]MCM0600901.1 primosomal protein N' [Periweissella ghanensis]CAH0417681.1 Primosomal protein N' [Periweissella ghanensis]